MKNKPRDESYWKMLGDEFGWTLTGYDNAPICATYAIAKTDRNFSVTDSVAKAFDQLLNARVGNAALTAAGDVEASATAEQLVQAWYGHSAPKTQMLGEDGNRLRTAIASALTAACAAATAAERERCAKVLCVACAEGLDYDIGLKLHRAADGFLSICSASAIREGEPRAAIRAATPASTEGEG